MGDKTIEDVLRGPDSGADAGLTIEDVLNPASLGPRPSVSSNQPTNPIQAYNAKFNPNETDLRVMGIKGSMAGIGTMLGGSGGIRATAAIPYAQKLGVGPAAVRAFLMAMGEAGGNFAGSTVSDIGTGMVTGKPVDWKGNAIASGVTGGLSLANSAAVPVLGWMGGVPRGGRTTPVGRPDFVKPVSQRAEYDLAANINDSASNIPLTEGKQALNDMIDAHDAAGLKINPKDIYNAMLGAHAPGSSPEARMANRMLVRDIHELELHYGTGPRSAKAISDMIEESLTTPVKGELQGKVGGRAYSDVRLNARNLAAQTLYKKLQALPGGPTPQAAGMSASEDLRVAKAVKDEFPLEPDTGLPKSGAASRVAQAGSSTDIEAPRILDQLKAFDERFGVKGQPRLYDEAIRLGQKRDWSPKDARMAEYIVNAAQLGKGRVPQVGGTRDFFRMLARQAVRSQGAFGAARRSIYGSIIGGAVSSPDQQKAFEDAMRRPNP